MHRTLYTLPCLSSLPHAVLGQALCRALFRSMKQKGRWEKKENFLCSLPSSCSCKSNWRKVWPTWLVETKSYRHGSNALTPIDLRPENLYKGLIVQGDKPLLGGVLLIPFMEADTIASEVSRCFSVFCLIASYSWGSFSFHFSFNTLKCKSEEI